MAKKDAEETTAPATVLRVRSYAERFCRAGFRFYQEPTDLPLFELSDEQIEAIENEPNLYSERV